MGSELFLDLMRGSCNYTTYPMRLTFKSHGDLSSEALASALRDGIGRGLRRLSVCRETPGCDCPFCTYFKLPDLPGFPGGVAPGFIIETAIRPPEIVPGANGELRLTLLGTAEAAYPWFAAALLHTGHVGIGCQPAEFVLDLEGEPIRNTVDDILRVSKARGGITRCRIHFDTPCIMKNNGLRRNSIDFGGLIKSIVARLQPNVGYWNGRTMRNSERDDVAADLLQRATKIECKFQNSGWVSEESLRFNGDRNSVSGFTGVLDVQGDLDPFWPFLIAGEAFHIGQRPHLDRGRYRIVTARA